MAGGGLVTRLVQYGGQEEQGGGDMNMQPVAAISPHATMAPPPPNHHKHIRGHHHHGHHHIRGHKETTACTISVTDERGFHGGVSVILLHSRPYTKVRCLVR